jgi:hypothetical protein
MLGTLALLVVVMGLLLTSLIGEPGDPRRAELSNVR